MVRTMMLAAVILIAANVQATAEPIERMVFGQGGKSCGSWTMARQTSRGAERAWMRHWVAGFVSGMNLDLAHPDALRGAVDFEGVVGWIDNFCQSNPLEIISTAGFRLMDELRSRAARK